MKYVLMHENDELAIFNYSNAIDDIAVSNDNKHLLPYLSYMYNTNKALINWINERCIPYTRDNIQSTLSITPFEFMINNLGLSLTDNYWIKPLSSNIQWNNINPHSVYFESSINLDRLYESKNRTFTPSCTLRGNLKKQWIIDNRTGDRILLKGNASRSCRQSICEVIATEVHRLQNIVPYTEYRYEKLVDSNNIITGCMSKCITTSKTELIHAIELTDSIKKDNSTNWFEFYIRRVVELGVSEQYIRNFLDYQIMTDFIISNTDRHFNNFGILRDSSTFKAVGVAPIFDSGNSMFYDVSYIPTNRKLLELETASFKRKEIQLLTLVSNRALVNINKLPSREFVYNQLILDETISEEDINRLLIAYTVKIKVLSDFQNGATVWNKDKYRL